MEGTIFQLYAANLYCESNCGSTYLNFQYMNSNKARDVTSERGLVFSRKHNILSFGQRGIEISFHSASSSTSLGTNFVMNKQILNANAVCGLAYRTCQRGTPADQPSHWGLSDMST